MLKLLVTVLCLAALGCEKSAEQTPETALEKNIHLTPAAEVETGFPRDKGDAEVRLNEKLQELEKRLTRLSQRQPKAVPAEQDEYARSLALIRSLQVESTEKVRAFAPVSPTDWKEPFQKANLALIEFEKRIQDIE